MQIGNRSQAFEWYQFDDLQWSLTQISKSRFYSTLNNSKTIQDRYNRMAPFSMTLKNLNDLWRRYQGQAIIWRWMSWKRYDIHAYTDSPKTPTVIFTSVLVLIMRTSLVVNVRTSSLINSVHQIIYYVVWYMADSDWSEFWIGVYFPLYIMFV